MKRRLFTDLEIGAALRELEAGTRLPEVCARLGVSERTLNRWRREARGDRSAGAPPLGLVPLSSDQAAIRSDALERHVQALRLVLHTLLEPAELERGARLLEARCQLSAQRARRLLGLPPVNLREHPQREPAPPSQLASFVRELP